MRKFAIALIIGIALSQIANAQSAYVRSIEKWRSDYEAKLVADDGWLTVAGLFWLNEGNNTVGAGDEFDVRLTDSFNGGKFGEIDLSGDVATLRVEPDVAAESDGREVKTIRLLPEVDGKATRINVGSQTFYLIKREDRFGIRLKDRNNRPRREYEGSNWFPVNAKYRTTATFEAFPEPKEIDIPNVLGGIFKLQSPGILRFRIAGRVMTLQPVIDEDKLFIIFRDLTSRTSTYGAGRFLYADLPNNGKVILDFNKAENPPCAFTEYATCPLPPQQNRLKVAIPAGEKRYKKGS